MPPAIRLNRNANVQRSHDSLLQIKFSIKCCRRGHIIWSGTPDSPGCSVRLTTLKKMDGDLALETPLTAGYCSILSCSLVLRTGATSGNTAPPVSLLSWRRVLGLESFGRYLARWDLKLSSASV